MGQRSGMKRRVRKQGQRLQWRRQASDRRPSGQHTQGEPPTTQRMRRAGHTYMPSRGIAARLGTRCHVLQTNFPHARAEVQLVVSGGRHAAAAGGERVQGAGVGGVAG